MLSALVLLVCSSDPVWPTRSLDAGQTVHYTGELTETSERAGQRFRHLHTVETSLTVFSVSRGVAEGAVMTAVTPNRDRSIAAASLTISGRAEAAPLPTIRVNLVRLPANGRIEVAELPNMPPPWAALNYRDGPAPLPFGAPSIELTPFGQTPLTWTRHGDELWNGSRVIDLVGRQQSPEFDDLAKSPTGWRRTDRRFVSPIDGLPRSLVRTIEQREGKAIVTTSELKLTMSAAMPIIDETARRRTKADAEAAAWFGAEADRVIRGGEAARRFRETVQRYLQTHPETTRFRAALESLIR